MSYIQHWTSLDWNNDEKSVYDLYTDLFQVTSNTEKLKIHNILEYISGANGQRNSVRDAGHSIFIESAHIIKGAKIMIVYGLFTGRQASDCWARKMILEKH